MRRVFADTFYWIALALPRDAYHDRAMAASRKLDGTPIVTTDEVLSEFLTFFAAMRPELRSRAVLLVESLMNSSVVTVLPQTQESFLAGLTLYRDRPDKGYSLVDCVSMCAMKREGVVEILTGDVHFAQEGFKAILLDS
ncbi:MAG: PIN domain-containing protein [Candidatus Hydrogenedentes bacterium]|nr:PIN domain-containing protein [Candidatus Hydrogenedentota bacterium]